MSGGRSSGVHAEASATVGCQKAKLQSSQVYKSLQRKALCGKMEMINLHLKEREYTYMKIFDEDNATEERK